MRRQSKVAGRTLHGVSVVALAVLVVLSVPRTDAADKMRVEVVETSAMVTLGSAPFIAVFAKVVLPDGSHASLICGDRSSDKNCAKIEPNAPAKMSPDATTCSTLGTQTTCVTRNLGTYDAERKGNELTIRAPNGKLKFRIVGSW
jgi:hypothetical protein